MNLTPAPPRDVMPPGQGLELPGRAMLPCMLRIARSACMGRAEFPGMKIMRPLAPGQARSAAPAARKVA